MAEMTIAQVDEALEQLRSAKMARLTSGVRTRTSFESGSVEKQYATLADIDGEIARLEVLRARLSGQRTSGGAIHVGFGGRT
jgi:hypothetical protein